MVSRHKKQALAKKHLTPIAHPALVMEDIAELKFDQSQPRVGNLINRARTKLKEAIDRELSQFDITAAQFVVLSMLEANSPESAAQLCRENCYDPGAMTRMIDRLEKKNFLRRVRSPADRRVISLELTEQGRAIHPTLRACSVNVASQFLRGFSQKEVVQFENLLERLLKNG
jgi:DNA-binding MarR family transcriptional regulator